MVREMRDEGNGRLPVAVLIPERHVEDLRHLLCEAFTEQELLRIAVAIGIQPEELPDPVCRGIARRLIDLAVERRLLADLLEECRETRPLHPWPALN